MEHNLYICQWSKSADGFTLWIKSRPQIRASGGTYAEAEERFIEAIQDAGGAMHAVMEFDPPLPKSELERKYSHLEIYQIVGDDCFEMDAPRWKWGETEQEIDERLRWNDAYFESPVCRQCRHARSRRSEKPLTLEYASRYDGAFGQVGSEGSNSLQIVSEGFLDLLTPEERAALELRPTIRKGRKKFFELIGPEGPPLVAVAGLKLAGWECSRCGYRTFGYFIEGLNIGDFVARADLPAKLPSVFTIGSYPEIELAVTAARWRELVGRKGTRGFISRLVGVAPENEVIRNPVLPLRDAEPTPSSLEEWLGSSPDDDE